MSELDCDEEAPFPKASSVFLILKTCFDRLRVARTPATRGPTTPDADDIYPPPPRKGRTKNGRRGFWRFFLSVSLASSSARKRRTTLAPSDSFRQVLEESEDDAQALLDYVEASGDLSEQGSIRVEPTRRDAESSSFLDSNGVGGMSLNERLEFSTMLASVEGSHVLEQEGDLIESIDAP